MDDAGWNKVYESLRDVECGALPTSACMHAYQLAKELVKLKPGSRVMLLEAVASEFCVHCGGPNPHCQCTNDE